MCVCVRVSSGVLGAVSPPGRQQGNSGLHHGSQRRVGDHRRSGHHHHVRLRRHAQRRERRILRQPQVTNGAGLGGDVSLSGDYKMWAEASGEAAFWLSSHQELREWRIDCWQEVEQEASWVGEGYSSWGGFARWRKCHISSCSLWRKTSTQRKDLGGWKWAQKALSEDVWMSGGELEGVQSLVFDSQMYLVFTVCAVCVHINICLIQMYVYRHPICMLLAMCCIRLTICIYLCDKEIIIRKKMLNTSNIPSIYHIPWVTM